MISLLVVNYRTSTLAIEAIRSARAASSEPLEVVVVDNSLDPSEADALRPHADVVIASTANRGYAGGINDGRKACHGEAIVVTNPDVVFAPGCIDLLAAALDGRTAVAGPALFWDDAHAWRLPPADLVTGWEKLDEVLASRSRVWFAQRDRRRFRKRVAFWSLTGTTPVRALSGAVLAIRTADFDAIGGFDERFALYFEENDFLRRLAANRRRIVYVPAARCRHLYNQSAGQDAPAAAQRYMESERKYLAKWNGPFAAQLLKKLEKPMKGYEAAPLPAELTVDRDDVIVEVSPLATFATAAGCIDQMRMQNAEGRMQKAEESRSSDLLHSAFGSSGLQQGPLYLRIVLRASGQILATYKITS